MTWRTGTMRMRRQSLAAWARAMVIGAALLLPLGRSQASPGRWSEDDFAHRVPMTLPVDAREATVVGALQTYVVQDGDTLLDVGRYYDLGYNEMIAANPGVDPWRPAPGEVLVIPTEYVLPAASYQGIIVNIPEMRLFYYKSEPGRGLTVTTYPVGLGRDD